MLLYHFTCVEHLPIILNEGLTRGEVPVSPTEVLTAVNLTDVPTPHGHGVDLGFLDKTAIRITVKIPAGDRALVRWRAFARKRLEPRWRAALEQGQRPDTWWLYWGVIPPTSFIAVEERNGDGYSPASFPPSS